MSLCIDLYQACQTEQGLSDVAAAAEQLQPKGITLSTTKVTDTLFIWSCLFNEFHGVFRYRLQFHFC